VLLVGVGLLALGVPAWPHHAFSSEFDDTKTITFAGVVTKVDWINPHAYFYVDSKDASGKVTNWVMESFPPGALRRAGMTREMMTVGATVTIQAFVARDGTKTLGWAHKIEFADGRVINISRDPNTPEGK
jgi:hypothetical protein